MYSTSMSSSVGADPSAVAEIRSLDRAAGGAVLGVEVDDQLLAAQVRALERAATGGGQGEILDRFTGHAMGLLANRLS